MYYRDNVVECWSYHFSTAEEERTDHVHHMQPAQTFFPSCICASVLPIIHLMEDQDVNPEGISGNYSLIQLNCRTFGVFFGGGWGGAKCHKLVSCL